MYFYRLPKVANFIVIVLAIWLVNIPTAFADRQTIIINEIVAWNSSLDQAVRTEKYCNMASSPFVFYRGTNHLFWRDFADDPRLDTFSSSQTDIWLQGDLHVNNFGAFDDDNGDIVYDLNDFDETIITNYQYDVWRMAVSLLLTARDNGDLSATEQAGVVDAFSESYLDTLARVRGNSQELTTILTAANTYGPLDNFLVDVENKNSRSEMLDDWTVFYQGKRIFNMALDDLDAVNNAIELTIQQAMAHYGTTLTGAISYDNSYFKIKSIAKRLHAGVGSLGTPRYYVLIEGKSTSQNDDRILDLKRQSKPSAYTYLGSGFKNQFDTQFTNQAARHQQAYNALTKHTDDHLGWITLTDGHYSVRERSPYKKTFPVTELYTLDRFSKLAEQWGQALAMGHARADKDDNASLISYSFEKQVDLLTDGKHSEFRAKVRQIAFDYADQVELDYGYFLSQLASGCTP